MFGPVRCFMTPVWGVVWAVGSDEELGLQKQFCCIWSWGKAFGGTYFIFWHYWAFQDPA